MNNYDEMYPRPPRPEDEQPAPPQQPGDPPEERPFYAAPPPEEPPFFGAPGQPFTPPPPPVPPVPKEPVQPMNRSVYIAAAVLAIMVFLLCIYCIGADMLHGALQNDGGPASPNVTVRIMVQDKPDLDPADENVTADGEYTVRGVAEMVTPSVVEVYTYSGSSRLPSALVGTGSGIIITEDGYIITNAHVVDGAEFEVKLSGESEKYPAKRIGSDNKTDLAVLKIEAGGLPAAILGNSDETYVGETVLAIGNPAGLTNSVTKGIVSAIGRQVRAKSDGFQMDCIQTDAAISPGNSGGALVNMYGQVIGITSSKYASEYSGVYEGLGFAITINEALPVITDLMEEGYVTGRFRIGIVFSSTTSEMVRADFAEKRGFALPAELNSAIWISEVSDECDISNTELKPDDFITEIEGKKVARFDDVITVLKGYKGGDTVTARCAHVDDDGKVSYYDITFRLEEDTSGNF